MSTIEALEELGAAQIGDFNSIGHLLDELEARALSSQTDGSSFLDRVARGIAFVTFAYDIDGVSMEIAKYGEALGELLGREGQRPVVHCLGGNFGDKVDVVLPSSWRRRLLHNADGWDKWQNGEWFERLFLVEMPEGSPASRDMAAIMWSEAVRLAQELAGIISDESIGLLIPVNVNSNPGNFALALALILASEVTGCPVLNINHDFFWEGGRPVEERPAGSQAGPRDHFFRNHTNRGFFAVFRRILPWDGRRWVQVNINPLQSQRLGQEGFAADRVFLIGTSISEGFIRPSSSRRKAENRRRMAHILSDGKPIAAAVSTAGFLEETAAWMSAQRPLVCALKEGAELDLTSPDTLVLLQPTRVVSRKRIPRDWELIGALLRHPPFRSEFERREHMAIVLLVTGPVPVEHRADLEDVLRAFAVVQESVPASVGVRLFQAFSVGNQRHPSLPEGLEIYDIYDAADMVLFPSETEGRGLPIVESAAAGIPIACARYDPESVFDEVVGARRPASERLRFLEFPRAAFGAAFLDAITNLLLDQQSFADAARHNQEVVRARFSMQNLQRSFADYLRRLRAAEQK